MKLKLFLNKGIPHQRMIAQRGFASKSSLPEFMSNYNKLFEKSKILERILPRQVNNQQLQEHFPYLFSHQEQFKHADTNAVNTGLLEPIYDLMDRGGKRWRPCLGLAFAECFGRDASKQDDDIYYACGITEIIHNGSLIADDIEDKSQLRRGKPCTYLKYGIDYAVNAGTLMYYAPIVKMKDFVKDERKRLQLMQIYSQELVNLHIGQNWDISWHHGTHIPTEDQYIQMVLNKTSVLPRLCVEFISILMDLNQGQSAKVIKYVETLGVAFQIQDDIISVISKEYEKERGVGEDIREGKRSLMVIHTMNKKDKSSQRLEEILNLQTDDEKLLREAIRIIIDNGSVQFAQERASSMLTEAWNELKPFLPEGQPKQNIEQLSHFLINRDL